MGRVPFLSGTAAARKIDFRFFNESARVLGFSMTPTVRPQYNFDSQMHV